MLSFFDTDTHSFGLITCVCVLHIKLLLPPIDAQHKQPVPVPIHHPRETSAVATNYDTGVLGRVQHSFLTQHCKIPTFAPPSWSYWCTPGSPADCDLSLEAVRCDNSGAFRPSSLSSSASRPPPSRLQDLERVYDASDIGTHENVV